MDIFYWWDYTIIYGAMIVSIAIGIYFRFSGGRQKTNEEYLLGDRNQSVVPVAVSLMASFMSAITLLNISAENYYYGMMFFNMNFGYLIGTPIATRLYLPVFFRLQNTSAYEYLEMRFGPRIRILASLTYTIQMVLYNSVVLCAPAVALEAVANIDKVLSIVIVGLVCTLYSTLGGMKAVLYTDLFQTSLTFLALLCIVVLTSISLGGFRKIFVEARTGGRLNFSNLNPTDGNAFAILLSGTITFLSLYGVNQTQVQRLLTLKTLEQSCDSLWLSWPILSIMSWMTSVIGLGMYAVYKGCDPYTNHGITAIDQLMPFYVIDTMKSVPGLPGLFVVGIFSASLSTISGSCNALAAVAITDYITRWIAVPQKYITVLTKSIACYYGIILLVFAFFADRLKGPILQSAMMVFGAVGGPLLGVFTLGMFTTFANEMGVTLGFLSGLLLTFWLSFRPTQSPPTELLSLTVDKCPQNTTMPSRIGEDRHMEYFPAYRISDVWISPIGLFWVLIVGSILSLLFRHSQPWEREGRKYPNPALFTPPLAGRLIAIEEEIRERAFNDQVFQVGNSR